MTIPVLLNHDPKQPIGVLEDDGSFRFFPKIEITKDMLFDIFGNCGVVILTMRTVADGRTFVESGEILLFSLDPGAAVSATRVRDLETKLAAVRNENEAAVSVAMTAVAAPYEARVREVEARLAKVISRIAPRCIARNPDVAQNRESKHPYCGACGLTTECAPSVAHYCPLEAQREECPVCGKGRRDGAVACSSCGYEYGTPLYGDEP